MTITEMMYWWEIKIIQICGSNEIKLWIIEHITTNMEEYSKKNINHIKGYWCINRFNPNVEISKFLGRIKYCLVEKNLKKKEKYKKHKY